MKTSQSKLYCNLCNCYISNKPNFSHHKRSKKHRNNCLSFQPQNVNFRESDNKPQLVHILSKNRVIGTMECAPNEQQRYGIISSISFINPDLIDLFSDVLLNKFSREMNDGNALIILSDDNHVEYFERLGAVETEVEFANKKVLNFHPSKDSIVRDIL